MKILKRSQSFKLLIVTFLILIITLVNTCGGDDDSDSNDSSKGNVFRGTVTSSDGSPLNAVHVRAVNVSDTNIQIAAFSGLGPDFTVVDGVFIIEFVPDGTYLLLIEKMDGRSLVFDDFRYSDFVQFNNPFLSFPDEYYNGAGESSSDDPLEFVEITVSDGQIIEGINFITNDVL